MKHIARDIPKKDTDDDWSDIDEGPWLEVGAKGKKVVKQTKAEKPQAPKIPVSVPKKAGPDGAKISTITSGHPLDPPKNPFEKRQAPLAPHLTKAQAPLAPVKVQSKVDVQPSTSGALKTKTPKAKNRTPIDSKLTPGQPQNPKQVVTPKVEKGERGKSKKQPNAKDQKAGAKDDANKRPKEEGQSSTKSEDKSQPRSSEQKKRDVKTQKRLTEHLDKTLKKTENQLKEAENAITKLTYLKSLESKIYGSFGKDDQAQQVRIEVLKHINSMEVSLQKIRLAKDQLLFDAEALRLRNARVEHERAYKKEDLALISLETKIDSETFKLNQERAVFEATNHLNVRKKVLENEAVNLENRNKAKALEINHMKLLAEESSLRLKRETYDVSKAEVEIGLEAKKFDMKKKEEDQDYENHIRVYKNRAIRMDLRIKEQQLEKATLENAVLEAKSAIQIKAMREELDKEAALKREKAETRAKFLEMALAVGLDYEISGDITSWSIYDFVDRDDINGKIKTEVKNSGNYKDWFKGIKPFDDGKEEARMEKRELDKVAFWRHPDRNVRRPIFDQHAWNAMSDKDKFKLFGFQPLVSYLRIKYFMSVREPALIHNMVVDSRAWLNSHDLTIDPTAYVIMVSSIMVAYIPSNEELSFRAVMKSARVVDRTRHLNDINSNNFGNYGFLARPKESWHERWGLASPASDSATQGGKRFV